MNVPFFDYRAQQLEALGLGPVPLQQYRELTTEMGARVRAGEIESRDSATTVTTCAICPGWSHHGTALEGREAAKEHRLTAHPEGFKRTKRKRSTKLIAPWVPRSESPFLCSVEGCANPTAAQGGKYTGYCWTHISVEKSKAEKQRKDGV